MDNLGLHVDDSITEAIEHAGYIVRYLPPYSPDFNPIEMSFHVLKSWITRYFWQKRTAYKSFGDFLKMVIEQSNYRQFALKQFHYTSSGLYIGKDKLKVLHN